MIYALAWSLKPVEHSGRPDWPICMLLYAWVQMSRTGNCARQFARPIWVANNHGLGGGSKIQMGPVHI